MTADILLATVIGGLINGGMYALLGIAIVLIFSTTSIANFAQGELATAGGFLALALILPLGLGMPASWALTLTLMGLAGVLIYAVLIRPGGERDHLNLTVRTLGLASILHATWVFKWAVNEPYKIPSLFGAGNIPLGPISVSRDQAGTLVVACLVGALFFLFFRFTMTGLTMRAMAVDRNNAALHGVNLRKTNAIVWFIATVISAVVGLLAAPISFLEAGLMQPYILKAFTAAIIGGMFSYPGVIAGALILGVSESFAAATVSLHVREPFAFAVLLLVLLLRPQGLFTRSGAQRRV